MPTCVSLGSDGISAVKINDLHNTAKRTVAGLNDLSGMFFDLCEKMKTPPVEDFRRICRDVLEECCAACESHERCALAANEEYIKEMADVLQAQGKISASDLSEDILGKCGKIPEIADGINYIGSLHMGRILESDRTEIYALEYAAMAELIEKNLTLDEEEYKGWTRRSPKKSARRWNGKISASPALCHSALAGK